MPPALARLLLRLFLPSDEGEAALDELDELFGVRKEHRGEWRARWWYRRQVGGFAVRLTASRVMRWVRRLGRRPGREGTMTGWGMEVRHALRRLIRAPVFAVASVLTVAVGVGLFAAIYSAVDGILLEPMPYEEPDELVWIWRDYTAWFDLDRGWLAGPDIAHLRERSEVFEGVVAVRSGRFNLTGREAERPREVEAMLASDDFFRVLGVDPSLGRGFRPGEDQPGAPAVVVLGHDLWRSQYGGDPEVVGRTIYLDGEPTRVAGVAPPDFRFVKHSSLGDPVPADLYTTLQTDLASMSPGAGSFAGLARVRDGASPATVDEALTSVAREVDRALGNRGLRLWSVGLKEDLVSKVRPALFALLGAATFLLLILAANLATLQMGRTGERARDMSVRAALGAGRIRLVRTLVIEAVLIAATGGVFGLVTAAWGVDALAALAPESLPRRAEIGLDLGVITIGGLMALVVGVSASLVGGSRILSGDPAGTFGVAGDRGTTGLRRARTRRSLVAAQVALSLTLLVGAGVLARAFADLLRADPGFDPGSAVTFRVPLDPNAYPDTPSRVELYGTLRRRLEAQPGVEAAGAVDGLPLTARANQTGVGFPGAPGNTGIPDQDESLVDVLRATPGYAEAVGLRLVEGRFFRGEDGDHVAVVDDVLARRFYPDRSAVGASMVVNADTVTVVGVVDQARLYRVHADDRGQVYSPYAQSGGSSLTFVLRGPADASSRDARARTVVAEVDPTLPLSDVRTLAEIVDASLSRERLSVTLVGLFALGALLLASLGIYGVVSGAVASRTREMGIRVALGAESARVVKMLLAQGLRPAITGVVIGLAGGAVAGRFLGDIVPGVRTSDPVPYVVVAGVALAVTLCAAYLPARRAAKIDPVEVLTPE